MPNLSGSVSAPSLDDTIAGKPFMFYWRRVRWLSVLALALYLVNLTWDIYPYLSWIVGGGLALWLNYWLARRYRVQYATALTAGVWLGVFSGLLLAVTDIIWYHKLWYLLNLVRLPFIGGCLGLVVSLVSYLFFLRITINNKKN